jgi:uncharacterized protein YdaU (DUF1376 family)
MVKQTDNSRIWFPVYAAQFMAETQALSDLEFRVYFRFKCHYWIHGSLPILDDRLARIAGISLNEWLLIRDEIAAFFNVDWRHLELDEEHSRSTEIREKRKLAGAAGARSRWQNKSKPNGKHHNT